MLTHTFKEEKKGNNESAAEVPIAESDYSRRLYIPASKEIVEALEIGSTIEVVLEGKVVGLEAREGEEYSSNEFTLKLKSVSIEEDKNEFAELAEENDD